MEDKIVPFNKIFLKLEKYRYNRLYDIAIEEFKERNRHFRSRPIAEIETDPDFRLATF